MLTTSTAKEVQQHLRGDTGRLAATYLIIIISLTLLFSAIIYSISSSQLNRPLTNHIGIDSAASQFDDFTRSSIQDLFDERANQARYQLLISLIFLNLAVLIGGAFLSYILARKTLEPIEAAMLAQAQFVSDASHELRTPLTALQVTNEVALRKKELTLAEATELIGYNLAETIKLRNLTEALLGLARQETSDSRLQDIRVDELVDEIIRTISPLAAEKSITLRSDVPSSTIYAVRPAITQIMTIFLDNALKYAPGNSLVVVHEERRGAVTTLSVTDQGPGISPEHHHKIFERFYRVDESRSSQNVSGNGLGLAIASAIAGRYGYYLRVDSATGSGSTFRLVIE